MASTEDIQSKLKLLPDKPGVYQFYDESGDLLYVGKAKSLRKRVASYFNRDRYESGKTRLLVKKIADVKHIVVSSEFEALLLENSMIKEHQPRFNIQLRDDKTYPWICIKNERFPRVFPTRNVIKDGSEYYGPYASVRRMKMVLEVVTKLYKVRTCNYDLSQEHIAAGKFKRCLEYQIGNCNAPCEGLETELEYNASIDDIRQIIKGNVTDVLKMIKGNMASYAQSLEFEKAAIAKQRLEALEHFQSKSVVVNPAIDDADVASIIADDVYAYVNFMRIAHGAVVQSHSIEFKKKLDETKEDILQNAIAEMRQLFRSNAKTIYVNEPIDTEWPEVTFHTPQRGDKKALIDLSLRNARLFMLERQKAQDKVDPERHSKRVLKQLRDDLRMQEMPVHIECFDNSNFQGSYPVAACVVFKNAKPSKQDYRHFNIKTVEGPDDFASMEEVIFRRYKRLLDENKSLPQLIVIDGGKGQLSAAVKALEALELRGRIAIIGIAKRLEEIYFPNDSIPLYIDKRSESLKLIQRLRNEAHRFGITHHRNKRSKNAFNSKLLEIQGIGEKTAKELLRSFYSVERISKLTKEELGEVVNEKIAAEVFNHFNS